MRNSILLTVELVYNPCTPLTPSLLLLIQDRVKFLFGVAGASAHTPRLLEELLPGRFGPHDLMEEPFSLLMQPHDNK